MKKFRFLILLFTIACLMYGCKKKEEVKVPEEKKQETQNTDPEKVPIQEDDTKNKVKSYLTGEWVDENFIKQRPAAVMINNIKDCLPQYGIEDAGVIYEALAEGGISRLMAIYEDYSSLQRIGSVRSARNYFIQFAMEYDAFYVHFGQSAFALDLLARDDVHNISGMDGQIEQLSFYRTEDRKSPHNAYTSGEGIQKGIEQLGYRKEYGENYKGHFKFAEDDKPVQLNGKEAFLVKTGYPVQKPWFEYDAEDGLYYRYEYGQAQIDQETGNQLKVSNILLQFCTSQNFDGTEYLNIDVESGGSAIYITNGKYQDITWMKKGETEPTIYYDSAGKEISLNQGKTWVCIITKNQEDSVEITGETENETN